MTTLPVQQGMVDKILDSLVTLLTQKLQTDIPADDASRLQTIKVGPRQDDPSAVVVLIHENDPDDPVRWPHFPMRYPEARRSGALIGSQEEMRGETQREQMRTPALYELIGGGSRIARAFTVEVEIWGDEVAGLTLERRDAGQLAAVVEHRLVKALRDAGPKIGNAAALSDSFGESVHMGPFFGNSWTDQEEGEALIVRKYTQLYYVCAQSWSTSAW